MMMRKKSKMGDDDEGKKRKKEKTITEQVKGWRCFEKKKSIHE